MNALIALALVSLAACVSAVPESHDYCVVGAGVAGTQLAYFLQRAGRDYAVFEQNAVPASFFTKFPRHRELISINKVWTGRPNKEFALRHDWNSIITDDDSLRFKHYSTDYFADAGLISTMATDVVKRFGIQIKFNTKVGNIRHHRDSQTCQYSMNDQHGKEYCCKVLIMAMGLWKSNKLNIPGAELIEDYSEFSVKQSDYTDKHVMILGFGNSAFETAKQVYRVTADTHIIGRGPLYQSIDTHYVGHLRSINNEIMDSHLLKSLDGVLYLRNWLLDVPDEKRDFNMLKIVRGANGRKYIHINGDDNANKYDNFLISQGYDHILACLGFWWTPEVFANDSRPSNFPENRQYSIPAQKYPLIDNGYTSPEFPHMYFVGSLAHSLDYRRSPGGFIHGFRYISKMIFQLMENKYELNRWTSYKMTLEELPGAFMRRVNEAAAPYEMYGTLGDIAIIDHVDNTVTYLEEFPIKLIHAFTKHSGHEFDPKRHSLVAMTFEYGANFSKITHQTDTFALGNSGLYVPLAHRAKFLHPVFFHYKTLPTVSDFEKLHSEQYMPKPDSYHAIITSVKLHWDGHESHLLPLRKWVESLTSQDLRFFNPTTCITLALASTHGVTDGLPLDCQHYLSSF
jgi:thioredoxin reductase